MCWRFFLCRPSGTNEYSKSQRSRTSVASLTFDTKITVLLHLQLFFLNVYSVWFVFISTLTQILRGHSVPSGNVREKEGR